MLPVAVSPTATRPVVDRPAARSAPAGSDPVCGGVSPSDAAGGSGAGADGELSVTASSYVPWRLENAPAAM